LTESEAIVLLSRRNFRNATSHKDEGLIHLFAGTTEEGDSAMADQLITQFHQLTADPAMLLSIGVGLCFFFGLFGLFLSSSESPRSKMSGRKLM